MTLAAKEYIVPLATSPKPTGGLESGSESNDASDMVFYREPPDRQTLLDWVAKEEIYVHTSIKIVDMEDGEGWRVVSSSSLSEGDLLFSAPKTALLSPRTSALWSLLPYPLKSMPNCSSPNQTNHTILIFALCILHELRLSEQSRWHGYLQSLPRPESVMGLLPVFWEGEGEDRTEALEWLRGTDTEVDLRRRKEQGISLNDILDFFTATSSLLPSTTSHPRPASFTQFSYAYTILSTRAFLIDLYHTTALVPFADILNHSSHPHTSLASDDFVCHICGSMPLCSHDALDSQGVPPRLADLPLHVRNRLEEEQDTVEMRLERDVRVGEEIWNTYGEMDDARLLVEYGFIGEEFAGEGLRSLGAGMEWTGKERRLWEGVMKTENFPAPLPRYSAKGAQDGTDMGVRPSRVDPDIKLSNAFDTLTLHDASMGNGLADIDEADEDDDADDTLLYVSPKHETQKNDDMNAPASAPKHDLDSGLQPYDGPDILHLSHNAQVSFPLFALIACKAVLCHSSSSPPESGAMAKRIRNCAVILERTYAETREEEDEYEEEDEGEDEGDEMEDEENDKEDEKGELRGVRGGADRLEGEEEDPNQDDNDNQNENENDIVNNDHDENHERPYTLDPLLPAGLPDPDCSDDRGLAIAIAQQIHRLLRSRQMLMHRHGLSLDDLLDLRDSLPKSRTRTRLAMTLSINERVLLLTAQHKWAETITRLSSRAQILGERLQQQ